jgi:hypothetical protein
MASNNVLILTAALVAATLQLALPNLDIDLRELGETISSPQPTTEQTARAR